MSKKILVIDDEPELIRAVAIRLRANGYEVATACDGQDGVNKVDEIKPDLILLDIIMPKMNGYEVCKKLKGSPNTSSIPIIIFTASGQRNLEKECLAIGANEIIMKPFECTALLDSIKKLLKL